MEAKTPATIRAAFLRLAAPGALALIPALAGCELFRPTVPEAIPVHHARAGEGPLLAGAAAVDITPSAPLPLAGYGLFRRGDGVHDPLWARALILRRGGVEAAVVAVDLIGIQSGDLARVQEAMREKVPGLDPRRVVIAATHTHSAPDTLGIWGLPPFISGKNNDYFNLVTNGILKALAEARGSLVEAELASGSAVVETEGFIKNLRRPGIVDREVVVLHVRKRGGGPTIATLAELGCHPEVLGSPNRRVSSDFPHWSRAGIEAALGGVAIHVSGALGAMVTPDVDRGEPESLEKEWAEAERIGSHLGAEVVEVVRRLGPYEQEPRLAIWHTPVYLQNQNSSYELARFFGILDRPLYRGGWFRTEVSHWRIGPLRIAAIPGEIAPGLGLRIRRDAGGRTMLIGLANDELGYLLPGSEYDLPIYDYERTLCPSREAGERIVDGLRQLALLAAQDEAAERGELPGRP